MSDRSGCAEDVRAEPVIPCWQVSGPKSWQHPLVLQRLGQEQMAPRVFSQALGHVPAQELYYSISSAFIQLVLCPITGGTAKCICGTRLLIFMP